MRLLIPLAPSSYLSNLFGPYLVFVICHFGSHVGEPADLCKYNRVHFSCVHLEFRVLKEWVVYGGLSIL